MIEKIQKQLLKERKDFKLDIKELKSNYGEIAMSRHLSQYLEEKGVARNQDDAWKNYVFPNREKLKVDCREALETIKMANGFAVVVHPGSPDFSFSRYGLSAAEEFKIFDELKKLNLAGIEVYYPLHTIKQTRQYLAMTKQLNILITRDSDYHSEKMSQNILKFRVFKSKFIYTI